MPTPEVPAQPAGVTSEQKKITARAGIVGLGTLASRVFGLGRDVSIAAVFSAAQTDAFWVAFTLPNALRQLLAEGAMSSAVVPVLGAVREKDGEGAARAFYARIRGLSLLVLALVSVAGVVGAPWLVDLFAGGMRARPGQFQLTISLTRIVFPYIFFMGTAALGAAALQNSGYFAAAAFAPALLNVALIVASFGLPWVLVSQGHDGALALGIGALVGGALQVVAQWPSLREAGYRVKPRLDLDDPRVRDVLTRIGPMMLGLGIYYVDLVVCRRLLSGQAEGSLSAFSWAQRLCDFPQGIFVMALSTAMLPTLSRLVAAGDLDEVSRTFSFGMRMVLFVALPISVLLVALGEPVVVAAFQRGEFKAEQAHQTALALMAQAAGLWTVAAVRQLVPVFFALGDTKVPVVVSGLDLLALIALAYGLTPWMGHVGVSVAVSGSSLVQMILLWVWLGRRLPDMHTGEIARSALRTLVASLVAGAGGWGAASIAAQAGTGWFARLLPAMAGGVAFAILFASLAWALGSDELQVLGGGLARKLGRRVRAASPRLRRMEKKTPAVPQVVEADFAAAAGPGSELPAPTFPEVAFAGRSNVGKSTLMNALLQRRNLVRTSSTPGCTRAVNLFKARCADGLELFLVDLPGFGYAQRSKSERSSWGPLLEGYLKRRASLRAVVILVDARRGPEDEEKQLIEFLASSQEATRPPLSILLVATKIDKLASSQRQNAVRQAGLPGMPAVGFSGVTGDGVELLWKKIRQGIGVSL